LSRLELAPQHAPVVRNGADEVPAIVCVRAHTQEIAILSYLDHLKLPRVERLLREAIEKVPRCIRAAGARALSVLVVEGRSIGSPLSTELLDAPMFPNPRPVLFGATANPRLSLSVTPRPSIRRRVAHT
jgi:hypothetical protein